MRSAGSTHYYCVRGASYRNVADHKGNHAHHRLAIVCYLSAVLTQVAQTTQHEFAQRLPNTRGVSLEHAQFERRIAGAHPPCVACQRAHAAAPGRRAVDLCYQSSFASMAASPLQSLAGNPPAESMNGRNTMSLITLANV